MNPFQRRQKLFHQPIKWWQAFFENAIDIFLVDYFSKRRTIYWGYYLNFLEKLLQILLEKRPGLANKKILFQKLHNCSFNLCHTHTICQIYFSLFPNLKKFLAGQLSKWCLFWEVNESSYKNVIKTLEHRWEKCILEKYEKNKIIILPDFQFFSSRGRKIFFPSSY